MTRKPKESPEPSSCAGVAVLAVVGSGVLGAVWTAAPDYALLGLWGLGVGAVWWAVRRPNKIDNPSPPPPTSPLENAKKQVRIVEGDSPYHWKVVHSPVDKEGTTT